MLRKLHLPIVLFFVLSAALAGIQASVAQENQGEDWIVFLSSMEGDMEIYRIRPDGSDLQNLTNHPA